MQPTSQPRYAIWQLMVVIAALAGVLALPRILRSPDRLVAACVFGVFGTLVLLNAMIEAVLGRVCPACSRRGLRRLARHRRYYLCVSCRARLKRTAFGPWIDASGPEDAARYHRPTDAGTWKGFRVPEELEGSNSGALLGSKRSRDLLDEVRQHPPRPVSGRRLERAEKKVREFLKRRNELEE